MTRYLILFVTLLLANCLCAQTTFYKAPFKSGEKITYHAYYNWHFVWVDAAEVVFTVDSLTMNDKPAYHFKAVAKSHPKYDFLYRVRDRFESIAQAEDLEPIWFERELHHRKKSSLHTYKFEKDANTIKTCVKRFEGDKFKDTIDNKLDLHDIMTAAFYARKLDFSNRQKDEKIPFKLIIDNELSDSYLRYLGRETVKTRKGRKFRCIKFSAYLIKGDFFKGGESMTIWVTDDENKLPIQVESDVLIGSVKAILTKTENLSYPLKAEIINR